VIEDQYEALPAPRSPGRKSIDPWSVTQRRRVRLRDDIFWQGRLDLRSQRVKGRVAPLIEVHDVTRPARCGRAAQCRHDPVLQQCRLSGAAVAEQQHKPGGIQHVDRRRASCALRASGIGSVERSDMVPSAPSVTPGGVGVSQVNRIASTFRADPSHARIDGRANGVPCVRR
jgi:hypothetical protein